MSLRPIETRDSMSMTLTRDGDKWVLRWENGHLYDSSPADVMIGFMKALVYLGYEAPHEHSERTEARIRAAFPGLSG